MSVPENKSQTFPTDSLPLASFLLAKGCNLLSIDKTNPRRALFKFAESEKRESLTKKFWQWEGIVEPRQFFAKQKDLKNMIFSSSYSV